MFFRKDSEVGCALRTMCLGKDNQRIVSLVRKPHPTWLVGGKSNSEYIPFRKYAC
jgi:hypothetical protein